MTETLGLSDHVPEPEKMTTVVIENKFSQQVASHAFFPPVKGTIKNLVMEVWKTQPGFLKKAIKVVEKGEALFHVVKWNPVDQVVAVRINP